MGGGSHAAAFETQQTAYPNLLAQQVLGSDALLAMDNRFSPEETSNGTMAPPLRF